MLHAPGGFVGRRSEGVWSTDQGPPRSRGASAPIPCRSVATPIATPQRHFGLPRPAAKSNQEPPMAWMGPGGPRRGGPGEPRGRRLSRKFAGMPICGSVADFRAQGRARKGRKRQYDHAGASLSWQGSCALSCPPFRGRAEWTGVGPGASEKAWERTAWNSTKS